MMLMRIPAFTPAVPMVADEAPVLAAVAKMPLAAATEQKVLLAPPPVFVSVGAVATASADQVEPLAKAANPAITMSPLCPGVIAKVPVVPEALLRTDADTSGW